MRNSSYISRINQFIETSVRDFNDSQYMTFGSNELTQEKLTEDCRYIWANTYRNYLDRVGLGHVELSQHLLEGVKMYSIPLPMVIVLSPEQILSDNGQLLFYQKVAHPTFERFSNRDSVVEFLTTKLLEGNEVYIYNLTKSIIIDPNNFMGNTVYGLRVGLIDWSDILEPKLSTKNFSPSKKIPKFVM